MARAIVPFPKSLLDLWHPVSNGAVTTEMVSAGSGRLFWWKCAKGHSWQATPLNLKRTGNCPACSNKLLIIGSNDLLTTHPNVASEWDNSNTLNPNQITAGYSKKVKWQCKYKHIWEAEVNRRVKTLSGCPYCSGQKSIVGETDLFTTHPFLKDEVHPLKNKDIILENIKANSKQKIWWLGKECGHEWETAPGNRAKGSGCPVCAGQKVLSGFNDLATVKPELAAEWHPTKNNTMLPNQIYFGSKQNIWWQCDKGHEWFVSPSSRVSKHSGCPTCNNRIILSGFNDLATFFPEIAKEWHPDNILLPTEVAPRSGKTVLWQCSREKHIWKSTIANRTGGSGCPVCAGQKVLTGYNDLTTTNPEIANEWHPTKNNIIPEKTHAGSEKPYWWLGKCGHEWETATKNRTLDNTGCPYCAGKKVLVGFNDISTTHPHFANEWHPTKNGTLTPQKVSMGSNKKIWWQCKKGHVFNNPPHKRLRSKNTSGCLECYIAITVSETEQEIYEYISSLGYLAEQGNRSMIRQELDIYIPEKKIAIEYNGVYWHSQRAGKHKNYHYNKWLACKNKGIRLIQIWEDDYIKNPELVKKHLNNTLSYHKDQLITKEDIVIKYLTQNEIQKFMNENHIEDFGRGNLILGSVETTVLGERIVSAMVLETTSNKSQIIEILQFATVKDNNDDFKLFIEYVSKTYLPKSISIYSDNCTAETIPYEKYGFISTQVTTPDYKYLIGNKRVNKNILTNKEPANLNRIWGAGKTKWELVL